MSNKWKIILALVGIALLTLIFKNLDGITEWLGNLITSGITGFFDALIGGMLGR